MKNKGLVIFIAVLLGLACIYELSFTYVVRKFESRAKEFASKGGSFNSEKYRTYLDSMGNKNILNLLITKADYFKAKEKELKLGLDLQGGMNVILEVSKGDIIKILAGQNQADPDVIAAIDKAKIDYQAGKGDFIDLFARYFRDKAPTRTLASVFSSLNNRQITASSSDDDVKEYLKREMKSKADNTRQVIEARLNQGNVTQPNIQELEGGRISVELPGVDNPSRIRTLLEQSARLEFWEVYGNNEKSQYEGLQVVWEAMNKAYNRKLRILKGDQDVDSAKIKAIEAIADSTARDSARKVYDKEQNAKDSAVYPFYTAGLQPFFPQKDPKTGEYTAAPYLGFVKKTSMNKISKMLEDEYVLKALPKNVRFAWSSEPLSEQSDEYALYALKADKNGKAQLGSGEENIIADAFATNSGSSGRVEVSMSMTNEASKDWKRITTNNVGRYIAIVLDNKVFSAPSVTNPISGGNSSISGGFSVAEATDLANVLKAGKLPAPATIIAEEIVGPTLGAESIKKGLNSMLIGFAAVLVLMVVYYRRAGIIATIAVFANVFLIIGILASWGAALTLPGIAGIVLTIGMAVDANVLIYERIKEELREGQVMKTAVKNGFRAAFSAIIDGNLTTLIAGIIMTFVGAGPVYGFAIVLIIGILTSLFTSIFITRILIERRVDSGKEVTFSNRFTENLMVGTNYDFVKNRKKFYLLSFAIIAIGFGVLIAKGGLSTTIDFKGGYSYQMMLPKGTAAEEIKNTLDNGLKGSSNEVKTIGTEGRYKIVTTYGLNEAYGADSVETDLVKALSKYSVTRASILSSSEVGPTIAANIRTKSMWVVIASIVAIFIYIIVRFKNVGFAVGGIVALLHDVLMVFAFFALLDGVVPFALEMDQNFIGAILTIIGYSINDTVVIFDRIRENMNEYKTETDKGKIINTAVNQTLSRTIMTSVTVIVVLLVLFLFGGPALKGFSLAMLIGCIMGSYSTICIASPIVLDLFKKDKPLL